MFRICPTDFQGGFPVGDDMLEVKGFNKKVQVMLLISKNPKQPPENGPGKKTCKSWDFNYQASTGWLARFLPVTEFRTFFKS